ncbi:MAG: GrdX family protein [Synergistales bacterium]|nr:GrdX family protein [Synergistales bacterium]
MAGIALDEVLLTNNPLVIRRCGRTVAVEGNAIDVLNRSLQYLEEGYRLVTHPLAGSIRLVCNPYRSLLLRHSGGREVDARGIQAVVDSIDRVHMAMRDRRIDMSLEEDYAVLDLEFVLKGAEAHCSEI